MARTTSPYINQLGLVRLNGEEELVVDAEDMESCFNLFRVPDSWAGFFAFEAKVPKSAFGGNPNEMTYVWMRSVPMGFVGAVDIMQTMARRLIFDTCGVDLAEELHKAKRVPVGNTAVVCMDGFDYVRRIAKGTQETAEPSEQIRKFRAACARFGLPISAGKQLVTATHACILGGELDGQLGWLAHAREKVGQSSRRWLR